MRASRYYLPVILGLMCACPAWAIPIITVGNFNLAANTPNQVITLQVTGGDAVTGFNLRAMLGNGSAAGAEPIFQSTTYGAGTLWAGNANKTSTGGPVPGFLADAQSSVVLNNTGETIAATGGLVTLTIDTTGLNSGTFPLSLKNTEIGVDSAFIGAGSVAIPATITNGSVTIVVPEPTSMAFLGLGGVCFLRRKRRVA